MWFQVAIRRFEYTKLKSSQETGFLNMTMSSLYSNALHSHHISIQNNSYSQGLKIKKKKIKKNDSTTIN